MLPVCSATMSERARTMEGLRAQSGRLRRRLLQLRALAPEARTEAEQAEMLHLAEEKVALDRELWRETARQDTEFQARRFLSAHSRDASPEWRASTPYKPNRWGTPVEYRWTDGFLEGVVDCARDGRQHWQVRGYLTVASGIPYGGEWLDADEYLRGWEYQQGTNREGRVTALVQEAQRRIERLADRHHELLPYHAWLGIRLDDQQADLLDVFDVQFETSATAAECCVRPCIVFRGGRLQRVLFRATPVSDEAITANVPEVLRPEEGLGEPEAAFEMLGWLEARLTPETKRSAIEWWLRRPTTT